MDEVYKFDSCNSSSSCPLDDSNILFGDGISSNPLTADEAAEFAAGLEMNMSSDIIKTQIANHPLYPNLLQAYIDCRKVGAPAEMASILEEMSREKHPIIPISTSTSHELGTADPELDHFMRSYCSVLHKYKEELSKPYDEATNFLSTIGSQLTHLCKQTLPTSTTYPPHSPPGTDEELKEMLMHKYSGYLSRLKKELLKKRKKCKLPKNALNALLDWWNTHYRWPYPTEEEKNRLSEITGLEQKQINNWFINQRKRHWRPSEDMRFALMDGIGAHTSTNP